LLYCPRLFFLEEIEELRIADEAVWAGRRLHEELAPDEPGLESFTLESPSLGIRGKLDAVRRQHGESVVIEHKRGRSLRDGRGNAHAWDSDYVQACAYVMLLEEHLGEPVRQARIRYHRDQATVLIDVGPQERQRVLDAIAQARALSRATARPPVHDNPSKCVRCSLAPVCLPEETRLATAIEREVPDDEQPTPVRLFPPDTERRPLHITSHGCQLGLRRGRLQISQGKETLHSAPLREVSDVNLYGHSQITTQALRACFDEQIPVHYFSAGGSWAGSSFGAVLATQRRVRQYSALCDPTTRRELANRLICAKIHHQLTHLLRATRGDTSSRGAIEEHLTTLRLSLRSARRSDSDQELLGHEGRAARAYFAALSGLIATQADERMRPKGRTRNPPLDRFNAALSFGYALLYRDVLAAVIRVGLEPALGLLHTPRTSAPPLALDLQELWRVAMVDMPILAAVNRLLLHPDEDFEVTHKRVWLSETGRKKVIEVYERRKHEEYTHPKLGYACSYHRLIELEVRLLEKEWTDAAGLFATFRFR
jgi:CRISPR-associated protein Cas1